VTNLDPATGIYEQFVGLHALEPMELAAYAERTVPIDVVRAQRLHTSRIRTSWRTPPTAIVVAREHGTDRPGIVKWRAMRKLLTRGPARQRSACIRQYPAR